MDEVVSNVSAWHGGDSACTNVVNRLRRYTVVDARTSKLLVERSGDSGLPMACKMGASCAVVGDCTPSPDEYIRLQRLGQEQ